MEKKKKNLPAEQYVKQPYPVSALASDLSLVQTHILVEMMDSVSAKVNEMFNQGGSKLLFKDEDFIDGMAHIDVDFRSLTNRPDSYRDVESVAVKMTHAQMEYIEEKPDGLTKIVINAFESVEIPQDGNRRRGIIRFNLTKRQASSLFDFTRYSKYLKSVARSTSSVYTARIYMLITAWRKFGVWDADYQELRKSLGCNAYNEQTKLWEQKKYREYRQFKRRVLKTAEEELKRLADEGTVDCYFDFDEVYLSGRVSAQPDKIHFTIHTTEMGRLEDKRQREVHHFYELQGEMQTLFSLTEQECRQILSRIDEDVVEQFSIRVQEIARSIKRQGDKILNPKGYALKCLNEAVLEFTPTAETVQTKAGQTATGTSPQGSGTGKPSATATDTSSSDTQHTPSEAELQQFQQFVQSCQGQTKMLTALEGMTLRSDSEGTYLSIPSRTFAEAFADEIGEIVKATGLKVKVNG